MIRVVLGLILLLSGFTPAFAADDARCKSGVVSATGKASSIGALARANSFFTWKAVAQDRFGKEYMAWSYGTERKLICVELMSGDNKGKWECTREARPCIGQAAADPIAVSSSSGSCKETITKAYGARQKSNAGAKAEARAGWKKAVISTHGAGWANWGKAKSRSLDCRRKNARQFQCIALGYACKN